VEHSLESSKTTSEPRITSVVEVRRNVLPKSIGVVFLIGEGEYHYKKEEMKNFIPYEGPKAIRYCGLFGKYDVKNCSSLCLLCKRHLRASSRERGDIPVPYVLPGHITIIFVTCYNCRYKNYD
jgi:hypothetical protein